MCPQRPHLNHLHSPGQGSPSGPKFLLCSGTGAAGLEPQAHQAVPLQRLDERRKGVSVQQESLGHVLDEVQVLVGGDALLPFLLAGPPLVCGALEIKFEVHLDHAWQDVVHDHYPDVLAPGLHTVQPVEFGQERPRILVEVLGGYERGKSVSRKQLGGHALPGSHSHTLWPHTQPLRSQARGHLLRKPP